MLSCLGHYLAGLAGKSAAVASQPKPSATPEPCQPNLSAMRGVLLGSYMRVE